MKRLVLVALLAASSACRVGGGERGPAATDFYGELAANGDWVELAPYGAVWQPSAAVVGPDFYPYFTGGWWVSTDDGWSWQSAWSWGWIPFHHGRWVLAPTFGWVWVPGDEWAPAWVEWRVGGGNVGWVPLGPQGVTTVLADYHPRWCFVPLTHFPQRDFHRARLPAWREYAAYHAATSIPFERGDVRRGPSVDLVRRARGEVTESSEEPRRLRRGDVRAESRVGPGSHVPTHAVTAPTPEATTPPPAPQALRMPPPPGAEGPKPTKKQGRKSAVTRRPAPFPP